MPYYCNLGRLPPKRHIQFRRPDGALYSEDPSQGTFNICDNGPANIQPIVQILVKL